MVLESFVYAIIIPMEGSTKNRLLFWKVPSLTEGNKNNHVRLQDARAHLENTMHFGQDCNDMLFNSLWGNTLGHSLGYSWVSHFNTYNRWFPTMELNTERTPKFHHIYDNVFLSRQTGWCQDIYINEQSYPGFTERLGTHCKWHSHCMTSLPKDTQSSELMAE